MGAFKPIANDTATDKRIYLLFPLKHVEEISTLSNRILEDQQYLTNGKDYLDVPYAILLM
jgi:hypothetical protein